jgi:hypothetical protein
VKGSIKVRRSEVGEVDVEFWTGERYIWGLTGKQEWTVFWTAQSDFIHQALIQMPGFFP